MDTRKVYLFDMDGTLVDSMPYWARSVLKILEEEGIAYTPEMIRTFTALGYIGTAKYYREHFGMTQSVDELVRRMKNNAIHEYTYNVTAKPFVPEYIRKLTKQGIRCCVLTASPHEITDVCLQRNGIFDLFTYVWSADDFGISKNNESIYSMVADKMGCAVTDIRFFDDNLLALEAGKRAGMELVGVYDTYSEDVKESIQAIVDTYIDSFEELL